MTTRNWINRLFARSPRTVRKTAARFRPSIETLETRLVPANYNAANATELIADITASNKIPGSNSITLTGTVTSATDSSNPYIIASAVITNEGPTGLPVIVAGNDLTISGNGQAISRKYIPSNAPGSVPTFRLFDVASGASLELDHVTLYGGAASGSGNWAQGGAIYSAGTLTLTNVTVENSYAQGVWQSDQSSQPLTTVPPGGGGVNTTPVVTPPPTNGEGGGIYIASGTANITNSTLHLNKAIGELSGAGPNNLDGSDGLGGGLYVAGGQVNIIGSTFDLDGAEGGVGGPNPGQRGGNGGNGYGGALCVAGGSVVLLNSTVSGNSAEGGMGGEGTFIQNGNVNAAPGTPNVVEAGFAGRGGNAYAGGVYVSGGSLTVGFSTIAGNTAYDGQGAPAVSIPDAALQGTTTQGALFSDPGSDGTASGGGVVIGGGIFISTNSIFAKNGTAAPFDLTIVTTGAAPSISPSDVVDSLAFTGASGFVGATDHNLIGAYSGSFDTSNDIIDPSFVGLGSLATNGGPTKTMALLPGSPAIDAGDDFWVGTLQYDQRGQGFARVVGSHVDIGAYESQNPSQTISFGPLVNQTYGATVTLSATSTSDLPVSFAVKSGPATISGNVLTVTGVGTIVVEATQAGNGTYPSATPVDQSFVASPADLYVTATANSKTYGQAASDTGTLSGVVNNDGITATFSSAGDAATAPVGTGSYTITGTLSDPNNKLSNYTVHETDANLTVKTADLYVTATANGKTYGQAASDTGKLSGVVNNDGITVTFSSAGDAATAPVGTGSYIITGTLSDPNNKLSNYTVHETDANLTVKTADLYVTATANGKTYGQAASDTGMLSGVVNNDGITATFSSAGDAATAPVGTGSYTITATLSDPNNKLANYTVHETDANLTVKRADLYVTAKANSKIQGEIASDSGKLSGVVNNDGITATFSSLGDAASAAAGQYTISATLADPNNKLSNYTVHQTTATLTVLSYADATTYLQTGKGFGVDTAGLASGLQSSLDSQLQAAIADFAAGDTADGVSQLGAFINHVSAQISKGITTGWAKQWIPYAQEIIKAVG
jgi:hypothetical protein